ncbi:MAG: SAM-dependent methyltransferase [Alphaproteobacteria bacterium]|nr:SAM-dependent methyltransferase [Alphaproteobacteria bacterium]
MFSEKFAKAVEMLQKDFALERSIDEKVCIDRDGNPIPWYTFPAIEYLSQFDYGQKQVFEYGCGSSSHFWAARAKYVVSIEDNPKWFEKWQQEMTEPNLDVRWRDEGEIYEKAIFEQDDLFDVIVIDGKRRAECCTAAVQKLAEGGMIILDDSDRINTSLEYRKSVAILKKADLIQVDFYGFCPMNCYTKATSLFLRRDFNFESKHEVQPVNGLGNLWSMSRQKRKDFYKKLG